MHYHAPLRHAECGASAAAIGPARRGLTLIELLVTIVIMVTVLAGVLPLVSPNNNARKIREASRQLTTLFSQAQAQAARDGRPVGVSFREFGATHPFSGMALEASIVAEPAPFAGFSEHSRVEVTNTNVAVYGTGAGGNGGELFVRDFNGANIDELTFTLADQPVPGNADALPPKTLRFGDVVEIGSYKFMIVDDGDPPNAPNASDEAPLDPTLLSANIFHCIWINRQPGQQYPQKVKSYQIRRQFSKSSDSPMQLPRGVGIDLQASGADGFNVPNQFDEMQPVAPGVRPPLNVTVMFSPNGALDSVWLGGIRSGGVDQVYFLLGLSENGNSAAQDPGDYDFAAGASITNDELAARRARINWLNADSRWVTANRAGRIITTENNVSFDPRHVAFSDSISGTPQEQNRTRLLRQLNGVDTDNDGDIDIPGARIYAKNMNASTGR